jgi:hypothetical protein
MLITVIALVLVASVTVNALVAQLRPAPGGRAMLRQVFAKRRMQVGIGILGFVTASVGTTFGRMLIPDHLAPSRAKQFGHLYVLALRQ